MRQDLEAEEPGVEGHSGVDVFDEVAVHPVLDLQRDAAAAEASAKAKADYDAQVAANLKARADAQAKAKADYDAAIAKRKADYDAAVAARAEALRQQQQKK